MDSELAELTRHLGRLATHYDVTSEWPEKSLAHLTAAGAWRWAIPKTHGGYELDPVSQLRAYEAVAAGSMASLLILTQRDRACEFIAAGSDEGLRDELLPQLRDHEFLTSVGISQIGTGQRSGRPALAAREKEGGFLLRGFMPWVTSATQCRFVVAGAVLPDDRQILGLLWTDRPGVVVDPPIKLMALECTQTAEIHCRDVFLEDRYVLRGPEERVLSSRSAVKPLVVAVAGIGHASALLRIVLTHASKTTGRLNELAEELAARYDAVRERIYKYADTLNRPDAGVPKTELRVAVNDLLVRLAVATLTYARGSGLIRQRDAQRLVREAFFFLVWSASKQVRVETLARLLDDPSPVERAMPSD